MTRKTHIGEFTVTFKPKYEKYPEKVAIPEECPPCDECEDCADSTCEPCPPCDECAVEGTYCVGDGFATCTDCQQAWCLCQQELEDAGCDLIPLAPAEPPITVLENGVVETVVLNSGIQSLFKILPIWYNTDIQFDFTIISPLVGTGFVRIRVRYISSSGTIVLDDTFPDTPGAPTSYSFPNIENQLIYVSLIRVGTFSTLEFLPTLIGASPFADCSECVTAYGDALCGAPDIPLADAETYLGKTVWVLEDGVALPKTVNATTTPVYFKIHVADYTDNVVFKIRIFNPTASGFYYIKLGSVATPLNFDFTAAVSYGIVDVDIPTAADQDIYLTLSRTGFLVSDYSATVTPTLFNHPPFANCGEAITALNDCNDDLTICEDALVDCENEIVILEGGLVECYETLLNCATEDDFVLYWSGGIHQASDLGGSPCITITPWTSLWGDAIFQNPNLCTPTAECTLFGNMCYCYTLNNLNFNCNGFITTSPCGTTILARQWLYISITSKFDFFAHMITFTKVEVSNAAGEVFIFDCNINTSPTPPDNLYLKTWMYRMNNDVWAMVSLLDAIITFTARIDFVDSIPPRVIEHKTILHINQP